MCIIVDTCALPSVFNCAAKNHKLFRPVLNWIVSGRGMLVYGGTRYKSELQNATKYLAIFAELKREGKLVEIHSDEVDRQQKKILRQFSNPDFDDSHLVAIVIVSHCRLVCTNDKRAIPFLTLAALYPKPSYRPKLYSYGARKRLLVDKYITDLCKPGKYGSKDLKKLFQF